MSGNRVFRPRGGRKRGKHAEIVVFNPTPGPPICRGSENSTCGAKAASPNNDAVLAQASHRIKERFAVTYPARGRVLGFVVLVQLPSGPYAAAFCRQWTPLESCPSAGFRRF